MADDAGIRSTKLIYNHTTLIKNIYSADMLIVLLPKRTKSFDVLSNLES